ncbi:TPA: antirestriction protein ArdR [Yersinia enterocolitica]
MDYIKKKNYIKTANVWRKQNPEHADSGVVLIWNDEVYGWKNSLRDPQDEQPGAIAVDIVGGVFVAEGGNCDDGANAWRLG